MLVKGTSACWIKQGQKMDDYTLFFYFKTSVVVAFEQEKQQHDQMHSVFKYFQVQVVWKYSVVYYNTYNRIKSIWSLALMNK